MLSWLSLRIAGLGAKLAVAGGIVIAILAAALRLVSIGRQQERGREASAAADALKQHQEIEHETRDLSDDRLDRDNAPWLRK
jgi:hypothetical protein